MMRQAACMCCWLTAMGAIFVAGCGGRPGPSSVQSRPAAATIKPAAATGYGGQAVASGQEIGFHGRVEWIEPLGRRELTVTPVHRDPRFALAVRVDQVGQQKTPIRAGRTTVFAIHSPTKLFARDTKAVIGGTFNFRVVWHTGPPERFSRLALGRFPAFVPRAD